MPEKLSTHMRAALRVIQNTGGEAHPVRGGWWCAKPDGPMLTFRISDHGLLRDSTVGTTTIYALRDRGLLEAIPNSGNHVHPAFQLTDAGRERAAI